MQQALPKSLWKPLPGHASGAMGQKADILMCAMAVFATVRTSTDVGMGAASDRLRPWSGLVWPHAQGPERKKSHALQDVALWFNAGGIALPCGIGRAALRIHFPGRLTSSCGSRAWH